MVPHLTTALTGPLLELERRFLAASPQIEHWLRGQWQEHTPPFYSSCDLRNSGFKLAPVDTNLFPGGFNNLNPAFLPLCVQAAMSAIEKFCPDARSLLLIPENHTRNQFYLQNVAQIAAILKQTGLTVRLGSLNPEVTQPTAWSMAALRSPMTTTSADPSAAPAAMVARIRSGSSSRGLSSVMTTRSASSAAMRPIGSRFPASRLPPAPKTTANRPLVCGRSVCSTASRAPGLWA